MSEFTEVLEEVQSIYKNALKDNKEINPIMLDKAKKFIARKIVETKDQGRKTAILENLKELSPAKLHFCSNRIHECPFVKDVLDID